jgi:hypothetical protein
MTLIPIHQKEKQRHTLLSVPDEESEISKNEEEIE